jgi:hypothetical protein
MLDGRRFERFEGLDLSKPLDEVGSESAISLLDMDWDRAGNPRSRDGCEAWTAEAGAAAYGELFVHSPSRLLSRRGKTLVAFDPSTQEEAKTQAIESEKHIAFTRFGTPTASYTYIADRVSPLLRYDGTNFTSPKITIKTWTGNEFEESGEKALPVGHFVATWRNAGNRLVVAGTGNEGGPGGETSSDSHVWFSEAADSDTWETTAYAQLTPGDGESIRGLVEWNGQIFVFKQTKLFVFYGQTTDENGVPEFNFRVIDLGSEVIEPRANGPEICVAGEDGVYFLTDEGVWVTTGQAPALISDALSPLADFRPIVGPAAEVIGEVRWPHATGIVGFGEKLLIPTADPEAPGEPGDLSLIYDIKYNRWTVWKTALRSAVEWKAGAEELERLLYFSGVGENHVYRFTRKTDSDPLITMAPHWQSGFYDFDNPDETVITRLKAFGEGTAQIAAADDFGALGSAKELAFGESLGERQLELAQRATHFSHRISGAEGTPFVLYSLTRYIEVSRVPATQDD